MLVHKIGIPEKILAANNSFVTTYTPAEFAWVLMVIAVTPALCEEFFFRGHFQRTLERTFGWKSVLIAGFIFGLFHFQPLGLMSLSILGLFWGYVYYRSQSILTSMAAHFTNNALVLFLNYRPHPKSQPYWDISQNISSVLLASSFIAAVFVIILFHRLTRKAAIPFLETVKEEPIPLRESFPPASAKPLKESVGDAANKFHKSRVFTFKEIEASKENICSAAHTGKTFFHTSETKGRTSGSENQQAHTPQTERKEITISILKQSSVTNQSNISGNATLTIQSLYFTLSIYHRRSPRNATCNKTHKTIESLTPNHTDQVA